MKEISSWNTIYGSVPGTEHAKTFLNNQDSMRIYEDNGIIIGIVADGCSAKNAKNSHLLHNEVGSNILADICLQTVRSYFLHYEENSLSSDILWDRITSDVLAQVKNLIHIIGQDFAAIAERYFQSTVLGYIITPSDTYVFGCGDGVYGVNDDIHIIPPACSQGNYPPYLIYSLIKSHVYAPNDPAIRLHQIAHYNTDDVQTIFVGTDGLVELIEAENTPIPAQQDAVGPLSNIWTDQLYQQNSFWLQNRLHLYNTPKIKRTENGISKVTGLLSDDTTIIVSIKKPQELWKQCISKDNKFN